MILDTWNAEAFLEYARPLKKLEKSFRSAGLFLTFHAFVDPFGNKMVRVIPNKATPKIICIEGDNPVQAVKDVAAGVRI